MSLYKEVQEFWSKKSLLDKFLFFAITNLLLAIFFGKIMIKLFKAGFEYMKNMYLPKKKEGEKWPSRLTNLPPSS
jgi:hypothetical protein